MGVVGGERGKGWGGKGSGLREGPPVAIGGWGTRKGSWDRPTSGGSQKDMKEGRPAATIDCVSARDGLRVWGGVVSLEVTKSSLALNQTSM